MDRDTQIVEARESFQRNLEWIARYDTRTSFMTGVLLLMFTLLVNASGSVTNWDTVTIVAFIVAFICLFASLMLIFVSQFPRKIVNEPSKRSVNFFGSVAGMPLDDFKKKFKDATSEEYLDDLLLQIYVNSVVLTKKFNYLRYASIFVGIATPFWFVALSHGKLLTSLVNLNL